MQVKIQVVGSVAVLESPLFKIEAIGKMTSVAYSKSEPSDEVIAKAERLKDCLLKIIELAEGVDAG